MLKGVGILCILAGSTGIGVVMAKELDLRIRELLTLQQMILFIRGEIRYMRQPLTDTFFHVSGSAPEPFRQFFSCTANEIEQRRGRTAGEIWRRNQKEYLSGLHISRQEASEFGKLGDVLGYLDVEMQVDTLDHYLEQLKLSTAHAMEAAKGKRKLYQYMGALSGAALSVLIF